MILKISTPSGACPVELKSSEPAAILEWAAKVRAHGEMTDRQYLVEALVFWSRSFDCVDPRDVFEVLVAEYPEERPLSSREWRSLLAGKLASKEERKAAKEEAKEEKKEAKKAEAVAKETGPKKRWLVFDKYPVTSVLRWMGKNGFSFEQARKALSSVQCDEVNDTTLRIQLAAGAKGQRGEPAPLTTTEANAITAAGGELVVKEKKSGVKFVVLGHPATAVCRTLGAKGWEFDAVTLAIETLGARGMSHTTMRMHYTAGKKKDTKWGEPAKLTKKQMTQLTEAAK